MESLIGQLPYAGWIIAIVVLILGVAAGVYMLEGYRSKKKEEETKGEDRLIDILQKTVTELDKKVTKQDTDIKELTEEVRKVKDENKLLREVLQGRDADSKEFYKQAFESIKLARETHDVVTTLAKNMEVSNSNTTKLIELLGKHLEVIDHKI